jgi:hypothetical protein
MLQLGGTEIEEEKEEGCTASRIKLLTFTLSYWVNYFV